MIFRTNSSKLFKVFSAHQYSQDIRVRFAPSPTGYLHLGGLRTAIYNYLFSKSHNGSFILRIEDTDQTRLVDGAIEQLHNDLEWAGIKIDEGPKIGGEFGPYIQSQRLNVYNEQIKVLLKNKSAYRCFCTEKRLDLIRRDALKARQVPKYDNRCRHLTEDEIEKKLSQNAKYCIRFKLLPNCETFEDMIHGNIAYDVALNEGDPVIMKSDLFPTYHFANVVDDHFMKITHVLRGIEWQISTTKHILIYRAFGWDPPKFGHLPLLLNADGTKLSKRQGDVKVHNFRHRGIYPKALINFITSSGGGFEKQQGMKIKILSIDELSTKFQIDRINTHSTKLMFELLPDFNKLEIAEQLNNEEKCNILVEEVQNLVKNHFKDSNECLQLEHNYVKSILKWSIPRINKLNDLVSNEMLFLWIMPSQNLSNVDQIQVKLIAILSDELKSANQHELKSYLKEFSNRNEIPFKELMQLLRFILSGAKDGPGVLEIIGMLGISQAVARLKHFEEKYKNV